MPLPPLTPEQRAANLASATAARRERSLALAELKSGTLSLADFLASPNETLRKTRVKQVLLALPDIGKVRAAKLMEEAKIAPGRRVKGLGPVQRATLEDLLAA